MVLSQKKQQIFDFLDRTYDVIDKRFFLKNTDINEWGYEISSCLPSIFSFHHLESLDMFKDWCKENGFSSREFDLAFKQHILITQYNDNMVNEMRIEYGISNADERAIELIATSLSKEINSELLLELSKKIKSIDEFMSLIKCFGYELSEARVNSKKYFISMNYNDIKNERTINTYWQDWIRSNKQD